MTSMTSEESDPNGIIIDTAKEISDSPSISMVPEDDDDDFGSFSDASFDDFEEPPIASTETEQSINHVQNAPKDEGNSYISFPDDIFQDESKFQESLDNLMSNIFTTVNEVTITSRTNSTSEASLLTERSKDIYEQLSLLPHLNPPNWTKSKIRRHLLISLGVPVNLDEILPGANAFNNLSISDIENLHNKEPDYVIPSINKFALTEEKINNIIRSSVKKIENIEENIESNTYIESLDQTDLATLIQKYKSHISLVEEIASVWSDKQEKLQKDRETYETVVENLVGHTQRLRREELLKRSKSEKSKKRKSFWKK